MASPTSTTLTARRLTAAVLSGLALLLISIFIFQPASAQREPARLKPPFKLVPIQKTQPLTGVPPLPLNAPIIMSQTFSSNFVFTTTYSENAYNFDVSDLRAPWHLVNYSGVVDNSYTWGRLATAPMTDTMWNAGTNPPQKDGLTPGTPYTVNMNSLLIYGPVNFSDYGSIVVSATYFLDVHTEDSYGLAYSLDGTNFTAVSNEVGRDPALSTRRTAFYNLPATARQSQVWLAFYFTSGDHPIDALGVFIDEVVVRGVRLNKVYLPIFRYDPTPTPTATATPSATNLYNYTFGTGTNASNQNFLDWGGDVSGASCFYTTGSSSCNWGQSLQTTGNPEGALQFYENGLYSWAAASPNNQTTANYEISADIFVVEPKKNARFGLIFNASTGVFGRDGNGDPVFDLNRNLYKIDLQFDETDETIIRYYRLEACINNITACSQPVGKTVIPTGYARNVGNWNNLKVQRQGTNLKVYLNNNLLINITDSTHTFVGEYGVFLQARDYNNAANPLKIRIDNVRVTSLP